MAAWVRMHMHMHMQMSSWVYMLYMHMHMHMCMCMHMWYLCVVGCTCGTRLEVVDTAHGHGTASVNSVEPGR